MGAQQMYVLAINTFENAFTSFVLSPERKFGIKNWFFFDVLLIYLVTFKQVVKTSFSSIPNLEICFANIQQGLRQDSEAATIKTG